MMKNWVSGVGGGVNHCFRVCDATPHSLDGVKVHHDNSDDGIWVVCVECTEQWDTLHSRVFRQGWKFSQSG